MAFNERATKLSKILLTFNPASDKICDTVSARITKGECHLNIDKLHTIFANYIRKFDIINDTNHDENCKWRLAAQFRALMDPDKPDFIAGMKKARAISEMLIDGQKKFCFGALVTCAEKDENAVRDLFRDLFADDGGSLILRQRKIDAFCSQANALTEKLHTSNAMFMNDQRSAMAYLFFQDPEHHYLYRAEKAKAFADAVGFQDSWGKGKSFKMDIYYRMCDELVAEIKKSDLLLKTTKRRYYSASGEPIDNVHPDKNYHILAFDIIWGTGIDDPDYNFGNGISWMSLDEMEEIAPPPRNQ